MQAACREAPTVEDERRAGAERTLNMSSMVVTLDVSKLSGRLKSTASCPVERRAFEAGGMRGRQVGERERWRMQAQARVRLGVGGAGFGRSAP